MLETLKLPFVDSQVLCEYFGSDVGMSKQLIKHNGFRIMKIVVQHYPKWMFWFSGGIVPPSSDKKSGVFFVGMGPNVDRSNH